MSEDKPEVIDAPEVEVMQPEETRELVIDDGDSMDRVIEVAAKIEAYSKAMDSILNVIIKRSYEGDWVCHAKSDDPPEKKKANLGAAAAERIAQFLGIQEKNWTPGIKEWSEDKAHYTWVYAADFGFKGRWIHAVGKAGTRDKFFGFADKEWRPLAEVQEDHIKTAAFRACRKEGVRTLFGLRSIPLAKLASLGYNLTNIAYAGFGEKGKELPAGAVKAEGLTERTIQITKWVRAEAKDADPKTGKPKWVRFDFIDVDGVKFGIFGEGKRVAKLKEDCEMKEPSTFSFQLKVSGDKGQYKNYEIVKVKGVEE